MSQPSVIVVTPNSFARFLGFAVESQFQLLLASRDLGSLHNFDLLFNSPLVNPRLDNGFKQTNPMAGYYLESFLKLRGYDAHVVFDWDDDAALERALRSDPIAVALSTTYITDNALLAVCLDALRAVVGELPIVVGGPYVWKQKMELDRDAGADPARIARAREFGVDLLADCLFAPTAEGAVRDALYVAHRFGEHTLLQLLEKLREGKASIEELSGVPNLVLPAPGGGWYATPESEEPVDLNEDFTRWDLVESVPAMVPLRASVGCPYRCRYCDFIELHPTVVMRSPDSIVREMQLAKARSGRFFGFVDDNIFISKKRISQLSRALIHKEINVAWGGFFRVDRIDESNIDSLAASGCRYGLCGIESADPGQLDRMRKNAKPAEVARGVELATEAGMNLNLSLVVGYPGETQQSLDNTIDYLNSVPTQNPGFASWLAYPFYLLPNTAVDELKYRRQFGLVGRKGDWRHATMSAEEVHGRWAAYVFRNVTALPYQYYAGDVPNHWSIDRRTHAFAARRELSGRFLDGATDESVQAAFGRFYGAVHDSGADSEAPAWQTVLAERSLQPGARSSFTGAFEQPR